LFATEPVAVITGAVRSSFHVAVREVVEILPQPSVAVHVLVCDLLQSPVTAPSDEVTVGVPQASVAVAVPSASFIVVVDGLHPRASAFPVAVSVGAVLSLVHVAVRAVVAVLPAPSVALNVLVCERLHPLLAIVPSVEVTLGVVHPSVAVAVPSAPFIVAVEGLQPKLRALPVAVIVGGVASIVTVTEVVAELEQEPIVAVTV
jgi:hypothetical protein